MKSMATSKDDALRYINATINRLEDERRKLWEKSDELGKKIDTLDQERDEISDCASELTSEIEKLTQARELLRSI